MSVMSKLVVTGIVTDRIGAAMWNGSFEAISSVEYRASQPAHIAVTVGHGGRDVGRCVHLERTQEDAIVAVAVVDGVDELLVPSMPSVYFSPELQLRAGGHDVVITTIALTMAPASIGLRPVEVIGGDVSAAAEAVRCRRRPALAARLDRAAVAQRRRGSYTTIEDPTALAHPTRLVGRVLLDGRDEVVAPEARTGRYVRDDQGRLLGPIEHRPARIVSVR
jgi:hypothetical protein